MPGVKTYIALDPSRYVQGARRVRAENQSLGASASSLKRVIGGVFAGVVAGIAVSEIRKVTAAFAEQERVDRLLESQILATGGAARLSVVDLKAQAAALQRATGIADEATQAQQAFLLSFKGIGREVFADVIEAAVDMKEVLPQGGEALTQIAKALDALANADTSQLTALRRSGTIISESQVEAARRLAETGKVAEAQRIIIAELQAQYGGAARAARDTLGGAQKALGVEFGDLREEIGSLLAGPGRDFIEWLVVQVRHAAEAVRAFHEWGSNFRKEIGGAAGALAGFRSLVAQVMSETVFAILQPVRALQAVNEAFSLLVPESSLRQGREVIRFLEELEESLDDVAKEQLAVAVDLSNQLSTELAKAGVAGVKMGNDIKIGTDKAKEALQDVPILAKKFAERIMAFGKAGQELGEPLKLEFIADGTTLSDSLLADIKPIPGEFADTLVATVREVAPTLGQLLGDELRNAAGAFGDALAAALVHALESGDIRGALQGLVSQTGSILGGLASTAIGVALPGVGGAILGPLAGAGIQVAFDAIAQSLASVEQTFADGGAVLGRLAAQLHEGTGQLAELTNQAVQSIVDTVNGIVEETGIALQELSPGSQRGTFGFQIRQRGDTIIAVKAWVDGVMREFDSIDQAIGFVVTEMIRRADASGADPFVRVALETFAGNTIDGLNRALAEAFERQQLVASVDQLGLGRLQALGIPEDIEDRVRRQAEAWNAQRNALEASLLAVRARILADQAQAESSAAVARVQVESNRTMLEGMLNLSEGMQAAGRSATVAGAIVSGAFDDALAAVDAALAGLDALIGESEIMEAVDRQRREANRGRREAREAARAAAQAELDLLIARAQGGAAAEELLRRQMEEAALIARLTEALPGLTAAEIELLQARIRSQAATESILAAGSDILDRIESQRIEELFGSVGSGIFDLADAMAEAQQQIFDAVQGGGSPFEAIRRMGELSDAAPDAIRRMLEAALESAASDPEAIAALRRQLSDLLLNLPQELEGQRDLIAAFAAGLGIDLANALSGAIITAQSSIASFGGELASALQRFGGAAAVTEEERARLLEIEFRLIQAQAVVRISQLRQEIAAMQALGALVSSQLDDLGFLETLASRLAELEPDFGVLAREVNGAQNAVRDFGDAAERTGEQLRQAAEAADAGLERLRDELLGGRLSGLSGIEQNQFALDRVRDLITRARGGDIDARRELESEGRNLIELAMQNLDVGGAGSQRQELLAALDDILRHPVPIPDDPVVAAIRQVRQAIDDLSVTQDSRLADLVAAANTIPAGLTSIKDGLKPIADGLGLVPIELQKIPTALDALGDILDNKPGGGGGGDLPNFKAATPGYVVDVPAFDQRNQTNFLLAEISGKLDAIEPKGATF